MSKPIKLYRVKVDANVGGYIETLARSKAEAKEFVTNRLRKASLHNAIDQIAGKSPYFFCPISWVEIIPEKTKVAKTKNKKHGKS